MSNALATTACSCQVCIKRAARGEAPLPGVTVAAEMHVIRDELEPSKRSGASTPQADVVTRAWINALVEGIAEVISEEAARRKKLGAQVAALQKHISELEGRIRPAEIEERLGKVEQRTAEFRYVGVWQPGNYQAGNFCTFDGSTWVCKVATSSRPGADVEAWQLTAKRGADAEARRSTRSNR